MLLLLLVVLRPLISQKDPQLNEKCKGKVQYTNTQVVYTMKEMNEVGAGLQDIIPNKRGVGRGLLALGTE